MFAGFQRLSETNSSLTLAPRPYPGRYWAPGNDINYQVCVKSFLTLLTPPRWARLQEKELNLSIIIILEVERHHGKYLEKYLENISKK